MGHELDESKGKPAIAFVGETPWHTLGKELTPNASIETWVKESGLDYDVAMATLTANVDVDGTRLEMAVPNRGALYRTDTNKVMGIASQSHHKIVQPRQIIEFFDDLVKEAGFTLEVAGALKGGARVWCLARTNMELVIGKPVGKAVRDVIRPYLLLSTVYDNMRSTLAQFTNVRVVCNNTIQMAYEEQKTDENQGRIQTYVSVPHSRTFDPNKVKADLQLVTKAAEQFKIKADALAKRKVTRQEAVAFVTALFAKRGKNGAITVQSERVMAGVVESIERGPGAHLLTASGTAWGLLNGVTHFIDFKMNSRTAEGRLNSAWFGDAARVKDKAMATLLKLLD